MYIVKVKGYKIEARAVDMQETEIAINGTYYDTYYGNHLNCPSEFLSPLAADIREGFVPFVGWPEENEDDQIFSSAIDLDCGEVSPDYPETTLEYIGLTVR